MAYSALLNKRPARIPITSSVIADTFSECVKFSAVSVSLLPVAFYSANEDTGGERIFFPCR